MAKLFIFTDKINKNKGESLTPPGIERNFKNGIKETIVLYAKKTLIYGLETIYKKYNIFILFRIFKRG